MQEDIPETLLETIAVEVAYALPDKQKIITLKVSTGTTARQAVRASNIVGEFPEIDVDAAILGIFSHTLGTKGMPRKQRAAKAREERAAQKAQQKAGQ